MKGYLRKLQGGMLVADNEETADWLNTKVKVGAVVSGEFVQPRNYEFHKKFFALLHFAFECWEPDLGEYNGLPVQKNFERFRKDITIACGFYDLVTNIRGETRAEAKSISFASMGEDEFNKLYQSTITLMISKYQILTGYRSWQEVDDVINQLLRFA